MLDMVIFKGKRFAASGRLDAGAYVKLTHQGTSLSERSGHHPSVHIAWPFSRMAHFSRICSSRASTRAAQVSFWNKLYSDCPQHPVLGALFRSQDSTSHAFSGPSSWMVLPYHPCWNQAKVAKKISPHPPMQPSGDASSMPTDVPVQRQLSPSTQWNSVVQVWP